MLIMRTAQGWLFLPREIPMKAVPGFCPEPANHRSGKKKATWRVGRTKAVKQAAILLLLLLTAASCQPRTTFYHPESVTLTSVEEKGTALRIDFAVAERGKWYDCPEVRVEKSDGRINLLFIRKPYDEVTSPVSSLTVANPDHLPVYVSNGENSIRIWPGGTHSPAVSR